MKKLTSVLALSTILLGGLSPTIQGIAETAELSGTSNDIAVKMDMHLRSQHKGAT
ncbi:hypothetical protein ACQ7AI_05565 [Lactococcus petauri]